MVAEDVLDRLRLGDVAQRRRGAVRVDVADALGLDARALERRAHHRRDAGRLRLGLGEVVRVVRGAVAENLAVDVGAAPLGRVPVLEQHRPEPSPMTKPARVASNGRDAFGGSSSSIARPRIAVKPARISGIKHDSVPPASTASALAALDHLRGFADRMRARGARRDDRVVRPADPERDRELPRDRVDQDAREEARRHAIRPAVAEDVRLLDDAGDAADRRAEDDPDAVGIEPLEPAVAQRFVACSHAEQDVPLELARLLGRNHVRRLEAGHLARDPDRQTVGVEGRDPADAALARERGAPRRRRIEPERRDTADAGDGDTFHPAATL